MEPPRGSSPPNNHNPDTSLRATDTNFRATYTNFRATDTNFRATDTNFRATDTNFRATDTNFRATDTSLRANDTNSSNVSLRLHDTYTNSLMALTNKRPRALEMQKPDRLPVFERLPPGI
jgi:hypothetical protein